jgi:hypothetical protein
VITADQLLAHAFGDYVLQSDWMATEKTRRSLAAAVHAFCYALPFLLLQPSLAAWATIVGSHFVIDRWRLARYVCWAKNWLSPVRPAPWSECAGTGYGPDKPVWLSTWLLIITDNALHALCNGAALRWL